MGMQAKYGSSKQAKSNKEDEHWQHPEPQQLWALVHGWKEELDQLMLSIVEHVGYHREFMPPGDMSAK